MIEGIELKKFKEIEGHGDSRTFEAQIWMDGKNVGTVGNNGWGGSHEYHFWDGDKRDVVAESEFNKRVKKWAAKESKKKDAYVSEYEPNDDLIEALILDMNTTKFIKRSKNTNQKKGFPITVLCRTGKEYMKLGEKRIFSGWKKEWCVGLRRPEQIEPYLMKNEVQEHIIA